MRGLVMDFAGDRRALGHRRRVSCSARPSWSAPVTAFHARSRDVYLPAGRALVRFPHRPRRRRAGARSTPTRPMSGCRCSCAPDRSCRPGPAVQTTAERADPPLTLHVFTGADGAFTLYEDDGVSRHICTAPSRASRSRWNEASGTLTIGARQGRLSRHGRAADDPRDLVRSPPSARGGLRPAGRCSRSAYSGAEVRVTAAMKKPAIEQNPDIRFLGKLLGDVIRAYGGEALFRADRIYPLHLGRPPSRRGRRPTRSIPASTRSASTTRSPSCAASCCSRCSPIWPRTGRASRPSRAPTVAEALERLAARGDRQGDGRCAARPRADRAGADRASDRSQAQEHDRPSQPHRRADARCATPGATETPEGDDRSSRRSRGRSPCCGRRARCAASGSTSPTRSRPRSSYLRDVFLPVLPALYARWERALGAAAAELPAARQLDRRRPRRQSLSSPPTRCGWRSARAREAVLGHYLDAGARARRRTVDLDRAGRGRRRASQRAGRRERRRSAEPRATSPIAAR